MPPRDVSNHVAGSTSYRTRSFSEIASTGKTLRRVEYNVYNMSTSIRISDDTKKQLETMKRDDETFDELLARLSRTEKDVDEMGGFADDDVVDGMAKTREELNESFEKRAQQE